MTTLEQRARSLADSLASTVTTISVGDSFEMDMEAAERMISDALKGVEREALKRAVRVACAFSMKKDRSLHPNVPWDSMDTAVKVAAHSASRQIAMEIQALIDTPVSETPDPRDRFRHKKRGTIYTVVGTAELQMATDLVDGSFLTIYQGGDSKLWARQEDEFNDGRFEKIEEVTTVRTPDPRDAEIARRTVEMPLSDANDLDAVVRALGIEDSDTTPTEAVAELHAEIERLRALVRTMDNAMKPFTQYARHFIDAEKFLAAREAARQALDRESVGDADGQS